MDDYNDLLFQAVKAAYPGEETVTPEWVATFSPEQLAEVANELDESYYANRGAFKNPEDFARQRFEYASQGSTPEEIEQRWEDSARLLDPATAGADRNFGRHARFLRGHLSHNSDARKSGMTFGQIFAPMANTGNLTPPHVMAYREDLDAGDYQIARPSESFELRYLMTEPETGLGSYMNSANIVPNSFRFNFGGLSDGDSVYDRSMDAFDQSVGHLNANRQNRLGMYNPSLDLPDDATDEEVNARYQELAGGYAAAQSPSSKERYLRSGYDLDETFGKALGNNLGKVAADAVYLGSDVLFDMADPSLAASVAAGAPAFTKNVLSGLAKQGLKKTLINTGKGAIKGAAPDFGAEAGLQAGFGFSTENNMQLPTQEQDEKNKQFRRQRRDDAVRYESPSDETYENQVAPLVQRLRRGPSGGGGGGGF